MSSSESPPSTAGDHSIDSALIAGLQNKRERVALLKLEQVLCDFMINSAAEWLEVGGSYNSLTLLSTEPEPPKAPVEVKQTSFQKLMCHRLADRFTIIREKGILLNHSIRFVKTKDSRIPESLLRDIKPSVYEVPTTGPSPQVLLRNDSNIKAPKLKIMKPSRNAATQSSGSTNSVGSTPKSNSSLTDKEKAYAEARARIFEQQGSAEGESAGVEDAANSLAAVAISASVSTLTASAPCFQPASDAKAVYRNREEEASDPDFQRGVTYGHAAYPDAYAAAARHSQEMYRAATTTTTQTVPPPSGQSWSSLAAGTVSTTERRDKTSPT